MSKEKIRWEQDDPEGPYWHNWRAWRGDRRMATVFLGSMPFPFQEGTHTVKVWTVLYALHAVDAQGNMLAGMVDQSRHNSLEDAKAWVENMLDEKGILHLRAEGPPEPAPGRFATIGEAEAWIRNNAEQERAGAALN